VNFILYIKGSELADFNYSKPFFESLKEGISNATFLDIDNFSENELIDFTIKALKESSKSSVVFDILPKSNMNALAKLAIYIADNPLGKNVFVYGNDPKINKILFPQDDFSYHDFPKEKLIEKISRFMNE
jgi:hypothetical protein